MRTKEIIAKNDWVLYRKPRGKVFNKQDPVRDPSPWKVVDVKGSMVTAESSAGEQVTRNSSSFTRLNRVQMDTQMVEGDESQQQDEAETNETQLRRSTRVGRGQIDKLKLDSNKKTYL